MDSKKPGYLNRVTNRFLSIYEASLKTPTSKSEIVTEQGYDVIAARSAKTQTGLQVERDSEDTLLARKGLSVYREMLTDATVLRTLNDKKFAVLSSDWSVVPASDEQRDIDIAEHCEWTFKRMDGTLSEAVRGFLSMLEWGYSVSEIIFDIVEAGKYSGSYGIKTIRLQGVDYIRLTPTEFGEVGSIAICQPDYTYKEVPMWKFPHIAHQKEFGLMFGRSDLRAVYKHYWSKNELLKLWNMYLETFGRPTRVAKYAAGKNITADAILNALKDMTGGALAIPDDMSLTFLEPQNAGSGFDAAIKWNDEQIVKGILGQTLTSGEGDRVGSMALGNVHAETREDWIAYLRKAVSELINEKVIRLWVDLNYAGVSEYPTLVWRPRKSGLTIATVADLSALGDTGMLTNRDVNKIREALSLPWSEDFDTDGIFLRPTPTPTGVDPMTFSQAAPEAPQTRHAHYKRTPKATSALDTKAATKTADVKEPARGWYEAERRLGGASYYKKQITKLDELEAGFIADTAPVVKSMQQNIQKYISEKILGGDPNKNRKAIKELKIPAGLLKEYDDIARAYMYNLTIESHYEAIDEIGEAFNNKGIPKSSEFGRMDLTLEAFPDADAALMVDSWIESGDWQSLKSYRAKRITDLAGTNESMAQFWITDIVETDLLKQVKNDVVAGILNKSSEQEIMAMVRKTFESYGANPELVDPARVKVIVRTNTTRAIAESRKLAFTDPEAAEAFPAMMLSVVMDDVTTDICSSVDGFVARVDDPIWDSMTPPLHYNCRTTLLSVPMREYEEVGSSEPPTEALEEMSASFGGLKLDG